MRAIAVAAACSGERYLSDRAGLNTRATLANSRRAAMAQIGSGRGLAVILFFPYAEAEKGRSQRLGME